MNYYFRTIAVWARYYVMSTDLDPQNVLKSLDLYLCSNTITFAYVIDTL